MRGIKEPLMVSCLRYKMRPCDTGEHLLAWPLMVCGTTALPLSYAGFTQVQHRIKVNEYGIVY